MKPDIKSLEHQIEEIQTALKIYDQTHIYNDEVFALCEKQQNLKRELSLLKGEETAVPFDYPYPWDTGAPLPHVVSNGYKTFLIYYIAERNPVWTAQEHPIIDLNTGYDDITALVEFTRCYEYKFGGVNDEVICAHPLSEHGLEAYRAHTVENSSWIKTQKKINSVHSNYNQEHWNKRKHYIFTFHDEIFECIADGYVVDVFSGRIQAVYEEASRRLFCYG